MQIDPFPSILKYVGEAISMNCSFDSTDDPLKSIAWFISNRKLEHTNLSAVSIPSSSSSVAIIPRIPSSYNNSQVGCKVDTLSGVEINSSLTKIVLQGCVTSFYYMYGPIYSFYSTSKWFGSQMLATKLHLN